MKAEAFYFINSNERAILPQDSPWQPRLQTGKTIGTSRIVEKREPIYQSAEEAPTICVLQVGHIEIRQPSSDNPAAAKTLYEVETPGYIFGIEPFLHESTRQQSAFAREKSVLLQIPYNHALELFMEQSSNATAYRMALLNQLAFQCIEVENRTEAEAFTYLKQQLAEYLLQYTERHGSSSMNMTQVALARTFSTSREAVYKALRALKEEGIIDRRNAQRTIFVKDRQALQNRVRPS